jgi:hypothetical protein
MNNLDFWLGLITGILSTVLVSQILHERRELKIKQLAALYAKHYRSGQ